MKVLIDSDILIEILRQRNEEILNGWFALGKSRSEILYSPITSAEIWAGAKPKETDQIQRVFLPMRCVRTDEVIGKTAGDFLNRYAKSHGLELPDAVIAASAYHSHAHLWTRNRRHYPMPQIAFYLD